MSIFYFNPFPEGRKFRSGPDSEEANSLTPWRTLPLCSVLFNVAQTQSSAQVGGLQSGKLVAQVRTHSLVRTELGSGEVL